LRSWSGRTPENFFYAPSLGGGLAASSPATGWADFLFFQISPRRSCHQPPRLRHLVDYRLSDNVSHPRLASFPRDLRQPFFESCACFRYPFDNCPPSFFLTTDAPPLRHITAPLFRVNSQKTLLDGSVRALPSSKIYPNQQGEVLIFLPSSYLRLPPRTSLRSCPFLLL